MKKKEQKTRSQRKFKHFILDDFQIRAIDAIESDHSVVVSAATGTGKTLIADYIIDKTLNHNMDEDSMNQKRVVYTAPIKALSNQKFSDFIQQYGKDRVGLITGDVVINSTAEVLIMTTEIYRNMLLTRDEIISSISHVIFDEIHYINDIERGTVWEESLIFSPKHIRFLALSATIPNSKEFAQWIESIKEHKVVVVKYGKRAVPLHHHMFDVDEGLCEPEDIKARLELDKYPNYDDAFRGRRGRGRNRRKKRFIPNPNHLDLVRDMQDKNWLPCVFFAFGRKLTEKMARECARRYDFASALERQEIVKTFNRYAPPEYATTQSSQMIRTLIRRGIGVHHAGILPFQKTIVEKLFEKGLIKVLYATETFAVGINMPAKSVAFQSLEKFDGINFRLLNSKEYFQMAGRAGRRGIDKVGHAVAMIDRNHCDLKRITTMTAEDRDPITSRFTLSFNTVLNLLHNHSRDEIEVIMKSNFDYFLKQKRNPGRQLRIMASFHNKEKFLERFDYIHKGELTERGQFARHIYSNEILVSEVFYDITDLSPVEIAILIAAIDYEERKSDRFDIVENNVSNKILKKVTRNKYVQKELRRNYVKRLSHVVKSWMEGEEFFNLLDVCNLQEGDIIRLFRRIIDISRQILRAQESKIDANQESIDKLHDTINLINRDLIKEEF